MKIITPAQCRAARSLLDINRDALAALSGVTLGTIGKFETGGAVTRSQSVNLLRLALETAGIDFIDDDGVRLHRDQIRVIKGEKAHRQLLDEIYADMKDAGGEVLIKGLNEDRWAHGDDKAFLDHHIDRLTKAGITERLLICETDGVVATHPHWYRTVPEKYFTPLTQWIFGGKLGLVSWGDIEQVTIIESLEVFYAAVKDFNLT